MYHKHQLIIKHYQLMPYNIKLKVPWTTATSKIFFRQGFLVKLIIDESLFAVGECAPMEAIGTESLGQAQQFLDKELSSLIDKPVDLNLLSDMKQFPACRFALETALLSLIAQYEQKNIALLLNPEANLQVKVNTMLGCINSDVPSHALQAEAQGFKCLKIKLGINSIENEAKELKKLLRQISPGTLIRLDANKSWSVKETEWLLNFLTPYTHQIDSIEEPLKDYNHSNYQSLQNSTEINLALDESFLINSREPINSPELNDSPEPINSLEQYPVKQLVLKPMAQGGIVKTLEITKQAQQSKIKTVITSSIETAYGLWPIAHLCAALNNNQYHGLATASWLEDTIIKPPEINHGIINL